jgi:hypothetical protein
MEVGQKDRGETMGHALLHARIGRTVGLGLFFIGTLAYRSEHAVIWGRWSLPYMAIIVTAGALFLLSLRHSWVRGQQPNPSRATVSLQSMCLDAAILFWAIGYILNGFEAPRNWGQVADANVFGSSSPVAAMLMWASLLAAVLSLAETVVPRGRTSRAGAVLLAVWLTVVVLVFGEGGLRLWSIATPEPQGYPTYATAMWARKYVIYNQAGFRDGDHAQAPTADERRLLVVGDSLAFGWGLKRPEDRFGEQLAIRLHGQTGSAWEVMNASLGDTHTLTHIRFLQSMQQYKADVVLLLYAFNDIDYLVSVTPREGPSEHMQGIIDRLNPTRILFANLFAFQELYVRLRILGYQLSADPESPYRQDAVLERHFQDLDRFVTLASSHGNVVAIIPFDIRVAASQSISEQYWHFVHAAQAYGLPIWPAGPEIFDTYSFKNLVVNKLDSHPNALAHQLLADYITRPLQLALVKAADTRIALNASSSPLEQ